MGRRGGPAAAAAPGGTNKRRRPVRAPVRAGAVGRALSVVRQGLELGLEYGPRSVESILWVAETIEESVYLAGSLVRSGGTVRFELGNPPLRTGAFSAARLVWERQPVPPARLRLRPDPRGPWRPADGITPDAPISLRAGVPIRVEAEVPGDDVGSTVTVRLELESRAIPPLVWLQFRDVVGRG